TRLLKDESCFHEMPRCISKSRAASRKCRAASETRELLPENTAQHFKVANYFPKMLHGFSRRKAASRKCRPAFQSRRLLPQNAARLLKEEGCFREMPRAICKS